MNRTESIDTKHQTVKRRRHLMARERREAAYRVEIESAIDKVKGTKSRAWLGALMHQHVLRNVQGGRGPLITDDEGRVIRARGR